MASRDLEAAKAAYSEKDIELSMAAHDAKANLTGDDAATENHSGDANEYIKSLVFGGLDGIITTFAIVAAVNGAGLDTNTVILMGVANLVADAISMGLGDYISSKAEADAVQAEYDREKWELENYPDGERKEMIEVYEGKGLSSTDAVQFVDIMMKYPEFFLDKMMVDELNLMPPEDTADLWKEGFVTFLSFMAFGSVPLATYVIAKLAGVDGDGEGDLLFLISIIATAITMFLLGVVSGKFTKSNVWISGSKMLLNGGLAACAAYLIGWGLEHMLG
jgi:DNA damage-binding protein 1